MKWLLPALLFTIMFILFLNLVHAQNYKTMQIWYGVYALYDPETKQVYGYYDYINQMCIGEFRNISLFEAFFLYRP